MAQIREVLTLEDRFSATLSRYIRLAEQASGVTSQMARAAGITAAQTGTLSSALAQQATVSDTAARAAGQQSTALAEMADQTDRAAKAADGATEAMKRQERQQQQMGSVAKGLAGTLKSLAASYIGLQGIKTLVNTADQVSQINARLKLMTGSAEAAAAAQDKIFQAAQRSRGAYTDMANMVSQLGMMAPDTFGSTDELVSFAEQVQKQLAIAGANGAGAAAAITQLTQAMASGVLRGEELNSVFENATPIAQTIADYMGITTGQLRELASQGQVTADVVKNAMLSAAEETNAKFEEIPLTWSQVWTMAQNAALKALQPVLDIVSKMAQNMDTLGPAAAGAAIGLTSFAVASYMASGGIAAIGKAIDSVNPLITAVAFLIGAAAWAVIDFVQAAGSLEIAWLTAVDNVLTGLGNMKVKFVYGINTLQDSLDQLSIGAQSVAYGVADYFGDMKVNALTSIQGLANGAIDAINWMINQVNKIPGIAIDTVDKLTFAANAAAENEAAKAARASTLAGMRADAAARTAQRQADLDALKNQVYNDHMQRMVGIYNAKADLASKTTFEQGTGIDGIPPYDPIADTLTGIGKDVRDIKKEATLTGEDLKSLVDVSTGNYIKQVNLGGNTTVINIPGQNTGNTKADTDAVIERLKQVLAEQMAAGAVGAIANLL